MDFAHRLGFRAEYRYAIGTEAVEQVVELCEEIREEFPRSIFYLGQLVFENDRFYYRLSTTRRPSRSSGGSSSRACRPSSFPIRVLQPSRAETGMLSRRAGPPPGAVGLLGSDPSGFSSPRANSYTAGGSDSSGYLNAARLFRTAAYGTIAILPSARPPVSDSGRLHSARLPPRRRAPARCRLPIRPVFRFTWPRRAISPGGRRRRSSRDRSRRLRVSCSSFPGPRARTVPGSLPPPAPRCWLRARSSSAWPCNR